MPPVRQGSFCSPTWLGASVRPHFAAPVAAPRRGTLPALPRARHAFAGGVLGDGTASRIRWRHHRSFPAGLGQRDEPARISLAPGRRALPPRSPTAGGTAHCRSHGYRVSPYAEPVASAGTLQGSHAPDPLSRDPCAESLQLLPDRGLPLRIQSTLVGHPETHYSPVRSTDVAKKTLSRCVQERRGSTPTRARPQNHFPGRQRAGSEHEHASSMA